MFDWPFNAYDTWPMCGALYPPERVAGDPVVCTIRHNPSTTKHLNEELGFEWWG